MLTILTDSGSVDFDQARDIAKGIQVFVICVTFLTNVGFIYSKISRKGCRSAFLTAKFSIQLSLAFSGIVSALFSNVIIAIIVFDMEDHGLNCKTTYVANCFFFTFLPMIYCSGMILLAFDLLLRFKSDVYTTLAKSKAYPVLCLLLPWAIPFMVSCPLTMTDIAWELKCANNQSNRHVQAGIICCTIVPAGITLFLALGIALAVRPKRHYDFQQRSFDSPMYVIGNVTTSSSTTDGNNMNGTSGSTKKQQLNGSAKGSASSRTTVPIRSTLDEETYPSYSHTQGRTYGREKCELLFSMLFTAIVILPYSGIFIYVTEKYTRLFTTLLFYMVNRDTFLAYQTFSYMINLLPMVLPSVWLCTRY